MHQDAILLKGEITNMGPGWRKNGYWNWLWVVPPGQSRYKYVAGNIDPFMDIYIGKQISCMVVPTLVEGSVRYELDGLLQEESDVETILVEYLASKRFPGIGPTLAQKLYQQYGIGVLHELKFRLDAVAKTMNLTKAQQASLKNLEANEEEFGLMRVFPSLSENQVKRILKKYQSVALDMPLCEHLRRHLDELLDVVGIKTFDKVLLQDLHFSLDENYRLEKIFSHCIREVLQNTGDTFIGSHIEYNSDGSVRNTDWGKLQKKIMDGTFPLPIGATWNWVMEKMVEISLGGSIKIETRNGKHHLYEGTMYWSKNVVIDTVCDYVQRNEKGQLDESMRMSSWIKRKSKDGSLVVNQEQLAALRMASTYAMSFISGGPGRGKTYVAKYLLEFFEEIGHDVVFLGPTGRSVVRLKEAIDGYSECETIARFVCRNDLLRKNGKAYPGEMARTATGSTIPMSRRTVFVVDEVSMLALEEAAKLLKWVDNCRIIFLGDINQLKPVSPGSFLHDTLNTDAIPITYLIQNMRINIPVLGDHADKMLAGTLTRKDWNPDFRLDFLPRQNANQQYLSVQNYDEQLSKQIIDEYLMLLSNGNDHRDILCMTPMKNGQAGVNALNQKFQEILNPEVTRIPQKTAFGHGIVTKGMQCPLCCKINGMDVRIRDRVMNTRNDAEKEWCRFKNDDPSDDVVESGYGFFNGDTGIVESYIYGNTLEPGYLLIRLDDGRFVTVINDKDELKQLCHAWAITVHKAQGSEAKHVIFSIPYQTYATCFSFPFLTKNLMYTAVTRAKEDVVMLGVEDGFLQAQQTPQRQSASFVAMDIVNRLTA